MPTGVTFRTANDADAQVGSAIVTQALNDLAARQGRPPRSAPDDHSAAFRHVIATGAERVWLAVDGERPVAIGAVWIRGRLSFCGGLFVLPEWQGRGVGRALLERAFEGLPVAGGVAALTSNAANPVSNGLYGRHGIYPLFALLHLTGPVAVAKSPWSPRPDRGLAAEPLSLAHLGELQEIDGVVLETDRTIDHRWLIGVAQNPGWLARRRGRAVGYAYLGGDGSEGVGAVGPVATVRAQDQGAVLQFALAELAQRGFRQATVAVPGPNLAAQRLLWQAGFSFEGATGLLCASRPFGRFDRYVLVGNCLM